MPSTNSGIPSNQALKKVIAITNVLDPTDKLIKDYRFFI